LGDGSKVIPGMRTVGISLLYFSLDRDSNLVHIDMEKSTIIRMVP